MTRLCLSLIGVSIAIYSVLCEVQFDNVRKIELNEKDKYVVDNKLATKLNCNKGDVREFHYNSRNQLWGEAGGLIELEIDVTLLCLGEAGGNYVQPACKYLGELSNVRGNPVPYEKNQRPKRNVEQFSESSRPLRRSKRGFTDWVSNAWQKVKGFFRRLFNMDEPETRRESSDEVVITVTTEKPTTTTEKIYYEANEVDVFEPSKYQSIYNKPYEFIQLSDGSIPEIKFASSDTDESVRNLKRHMTEIFSTNLIMDKESKEEETPMGKHNTRYTYLKNNGETTTTAKPSSSLTENDHLTIVKKVKKGDIVNLTPMKGYNKNKGMNNAENMDLDTIQVQKYMEGSLVSAEGELNMAVNQLDKRRRRRSLNDDTFSHLAVKSSFTLELKRRTKRSLSHDHTEIENIEKQFNFSSSTLASSITSEIFEENRLQTLREKLADVSFSLENLADRSTDNLNYLLEALELEVKLDNKLLVNQIPQTITHLKVKKICLSGAKNLCNVGVLILSTIGGSEQEKLQLDLIDLFSSHKEIPNRISLLNHMAASVASFPSTSSGLLSSILDRITDPNMSPSVAGVLAISLSSLLTKNDVPAKVKSYCFDRLVAFVHDRATHCPVEDELVFQLIEALGMGEKYVKEIISVAQTCYHVHTYQLKVLKALRHSLNSSDTHKWIVKCMDEASCEFKVKVAEFLTSSVIKQRLIGDDEWPAVGFNDIDGYLKETLITLNKDELCDKADIVKYFEHKEAPEADTALTVYKKLQLAKGLNRKRRASSLWDNQLCDSWKNHKKSDKQPIDGFEEEGKMYNRWSHCSGKRKLGRDMANAVFDGGMFAGVKYPTNPPEYKVEASMSGEANFLGKDFELGRIGFSVNERKSKTYVELLGRNLLDLKGQNCTEDEYIYRPAQHVPLFSLNIWVIQLSLGIHLGVEANVQFKCPRSENEKYIFQPTTIARVGGEAAGRVLMLRAGVNLGGNFNYHMKADLNPYPGACFSAKHGNEPMSISLESWYQFYKPLTINDWTKRIRWRPSFLSWDVTGSNENDWLRTYCVLSDDDVTNATKPTTITVAP